MDVFTLFKLIHVLAVMMWFGAGVYSVVLAARLERAGEGPALAALGRQAEDLGKLYYMPLAIVTLIAGIVMVTQHDGYAFSDAWISIGFAGILLTAILGPALLSPTGRRLGDTIAEKGPMAPEVATLKRRLQLYEALDLAILAVVTWAMVYKPGL